MGPCGANDQISISYWMKLKSFRNGYELWINNVNDDVYSMGLALNTTWASG